jgi:tetratricopeptide (TPR) repeat protein
MWRYPRPDTWQAFEQILADWVHHSLGDTAADRYGRTGQRQNGIDILARNWRQASAGQTPELWAIQAKDYALGRLSPDDLQLELTKALTHSPTPDVFVVATTTPRDTLLQNWAIVATQHLYPTRVEVWFWDGLVEQCLKEAWFREKYLPTVWNRRIPHQLPPPPVEFTGRHSEIADVLAQLDGGVNAVILTGMGGIGKSAMALAIASHISDKYPDGQLRVDLRGTDAGTRTSATAAMLYVIRALDSGAPAFTSPTEIENHFHTTLHDKRALILLDDAYDSEQVQTFVPLHRGCVLVTSRQRLLLPGACSSALDTLSSGDSVTLLNRISSRFGELSDEVAELCGYLPLALRLAATSLSERPDLTAEEYCSRLRDERTRLELVNATVELSYQLLSEDLQRAWRYLSVFHAPFDVQAAAAVLNVPERAASDIAGQLLRHSMVEWDAASSRYSMHELLRLVADARLDASGREQVHLRHAEHFKRRLEILKTEYRQGGDSAVSALQQFDREIAHIRQCAEWLRLRLGHSDTFKRLFSVFMDRGVDMFPIRLDPGELVAWLTDAVSETRATHDTGATAAHLGNLGVALERVGDLKGALAVQEECLRAARESGDGGSIAKALGNLATLYLSSEQYSKCVELALESVRIEQQHGNRKGVAADLNTLGNAYLQMGDYEKSFLMFAQSLEVKRHIGDRLGEATTWAGIGALHSRQEKYVEAAGFLWRAVGLFRELGYKQGEQEARAALCLAILEAGAFGGLTPEQLAHISHERADDSIEFAERVIEHLSDGARVAKREGKLVDYAARIGDIGTLQSALGEEELAISLHNESIECARLASEPKLEANSHFNKAASLSRLGRISDAIATMEVARQLYEALGLPDAQEARNELEKLRRMGAAPAVRAPRRVAQPARKIGRNEKCPCGSGRKYKYCCLQEG